ncbi:hypothetical protein GQ457_06G023160 [Hibiscus cannabinus]
MSAQYEGNYVEALQNYYEAMRLEIDPYDRSYILYNIGLIHTSNGEHTKALEYYFRALERNPLLRYVISTHKNSLLDQGVQVHTTSLKTRFGFDLMLSNDLIDMYAQCGVVGNAPLVFDIKFERNMVSWTAFMCGHLQISNVRETLSLFFQMMILSCFKPNEYTFSKNFKACGILNVLEIGMQNHCMIILYGFDRVPMVGNSIVDMYSICRRINEASTMFTALPIILGKKG